MDAETQLHSGRALVREQKAEQTDGKCKLLISVLDHHQAKMGFYHFC